MNRWDMKSRRTRFQAAICVWLLLAAGRLGGAANALHAQEAYEYTPYRVKIWLATDHAASLGDAMVTRIQQGLLAQAEVAAGAAWRVTCERAPESLRPSILTSLDLLTVSDVMSADEQADTFDKIMLVGVAPAVDGMRVVAREFDGQILFMGRTIQDTYHQPDFLTLGIFQTMTAAFSPVARIEDSRGKSATVRVKAGGLIVSESNPCYIQQGDVLQAIIKQSDRKGKTKNVEPVPWTFLNVEESTDTMVGELHKFPLVFNCQVNTAGRNQLQGRGTARVQRFGMLVRARGTTTTLRLVGNTDSIPLEGYEVFGKSPITVEGETNNAELLGRTDWRGVIEIAQDPEFPLRLIYVKNGSFLLARLPIVPGLDAEILAPLTNDDKRLEAEAFVKGIESTVMDLVARRAIIAARFRRRVQEFAKAKNKEEEDKKLADAKELLDQFTAMTTRSQLDELITSRQGSLASRNPQEKKRIDNMLGGARSLLSTFLDDELGSALAREYRAAVEGNPILVAQPSSDDDATGDAEVAEQ